MALDLIFVSIVHGFLNTAESRAAGVPTAAECALQMMDAEEDEVDPRLVVTADEAGEGRTRSVAVVVTARTNQGRAITAPWLSAVEARLRDGAALWAHLAALPAEMRRGWQLEAVTYPAPGNVKREETGVVESAVAVAFQVTLER